MTFKSTDMSLKKYFILAFFAVFVGYLHRAHISVMFENDKHFSHLSNLERELSFRSEQGLYYSYYKTLIESPSYLSGLYQITHDNVTEFPFTINTLQRFNLYPEVISAGLFRVFKYVSDWMNKSFTQCWRTDRGKDLSPVWSCEGLGDPMYFYVEMVFVLHGISLSTFFILAFYISESYLGGVLAVAAFFYNHGECTRVQWTPSLRESFGFPYIIIQMLVVTWILRSKEKHKYHLLALCVSTVCCLLPWQFSQFVLFTQVVAVMAVYVIDLIDSRTLLTFIYGQFLALLISYVLLFGNLMLISSLFTSSLLSAWVVVNLSSILSKFKYRLIRWTLCLFTFVMLTILIKSTLSKILNSEDDAHIIDILRSKFSNFHTFHSKLYTCSPEFDFLPLKVLIKLFKTAVLPMAGCMVIIVIFQVLRYLLFDAKTEEGETDEGPDPAVLYHVIQLLAYTSMALIIMRLKLFFTPQLCLCSGLVASTKYFRWLRKKSLYFPLLAILFAIMSYHGFGNLVERYRIKGEYNNHPLEKLMHWIDTKTPQSSAFAGSMPLMAAIKLTTNRPIVNHPHYEDVQLRERTKLIYQMYSRKPISELHKALTDLHVDYLLIDSMHCKGRSRLGCGMVDLWDEEDKINLANTPTCVKIRTAQKPYFKSVYVSDEYQVYKIIKSPKKPRL